MTTAELAEAKRSLERLIQIVESSCTCDDVGDELCAYCMNWVGH